MKALVDGTAGGAQYHRMKTQLLFLAACSSAMAATNDPPTLPPGAEHTSLAQLWFFGVAIVTPLIIAGMKKLAPNIPKVILPCASPFVGILVGLGLNALGAANLSWVDMGIAGGLGVTIREIVDQAVLTQLKPTTKS